MNSLQELESILTQLLSVVQEVIASGEVIDDDVQMALAETFSLLLERMEQIRSRDTTPTTPLQDQIEPSMPSSNVEGFAYDPKSNRLMVRFLGKHPNRNGAIYAYEKVPPVMFELFRKGAVPARTNGRNKWGRWWRGKNPSMGSSVYTLLKQGGFSYRRLT